MFREGFEKIAKITDREMEEWAKGQGRSDRKSLLLWMLGGTAIGAGVGTLTGIPMAVPAGTLAGYLRARRHNNLRELARDIMIMKPKERKEALDKLNPDKASFWTRHLSEHDVKEGRKAHIFSKK